MEERILFATPCRWIKFDMDPATDRDSSTPLRGTLCVTDAALEFSVLYKSYGGTVRAAQITDLFVKLIGEVTTSIPLNLIRRIQAIRFTSRFLFFKQEAVRLEVLYAPETGSDVLKKMVCFPHFGLEPARQPGMFHLDPEIGFLYQPSGAEAFNWERILRHLVEARCTASA
jgi:hypothetical protein